MIRILSILFALLAVKALAATDPIDPLRLPYGGTWSNLVGVSGGIPNRTTIYTTFQSTATSAQIQSGLDNCPSNKVVFCTNGTYTINTALNVKNGTTLRGGTNANGTPATIFNNTASVTITVGATSGWDTGSSANWTTRNISSGNTRGSTSVVVSSTPTGLAAGMIMWLAAPASANVHGSGFSDLFGSYPAVQIVTVTSVSGTTVNFSPAINADYWAGTCIVAYHASGDTHHLAGIENIKIWRSGGTVSSTSHYIQMNGTDQCWLKNVHTYWVAHGTYHVYLYACNRTEIRGCEMDKADLGTDASSTYCIVPQQNGAWWVEDNYFHNVANVMPIFGSSGCAFTYNYVNDLPYSTTNPDWLSQIVYYHGSHSAHNLFEGNWCAAHYNDHTPGSRNTLYFRERGRGWDATPSPNGKQNNSVYMNEDAPGSGTSYHEKAVIAGCVLGETNSVFHSTSWSNSVSGNPVLGIQSTSWASLVTTNDFATPSNAVLFALASGQLLPKSYLYFDAKPSWFGDRPWPWVDPTNTVKSLASYTYTNFPAGYRSLFITNPPSIDTTPPVLSNVGVPSIPGTTSATVTWDTDETVTNNWITFSVNSDLSSNTSTTNAMTGTTTLSVHLNGLTASTLYYYTANSVNQVGLVGSSTTNTFTTATPAAISLLGILNAIIKQ